MKREEQHTTANYLSEDTQKLIQHALAITAACLPTSHPDRQKFVELRAQLDHDFLCITSEMPEEQIEKELDPELEIYPHVQVYSKDSKEGTCPFCVKAFDWLDEKGIPYISIPQDMHQRQKLYDDLELQHFSRTVPQIFLVNGPDDRVRIGGYDKLIISGIESLFR